MKNNKVFEGGQTVYTVNAKTNEVDEWIISGVIPGNKYILTRGKYQCVLPGKCIFDDRDQALAVAKKQNFLN